MRDDEQFRQFVADRAPALRNLAYLVCGSWAVADDVLQESLIKAYLRWRTIHTDPEAYVRRVVVTAAVDESRRPHRREQPTASPPERVATGNAYGAVDARLAARDALTSLAPRQRAAVALRYWVGLDLEQVAELLGCSVGTVKSQSARGLATLRRELEGQEHLMQEDGS